MDDSEKWAAVEEGIELLQESRLEDAMAELLRVAEECSENEYAHYFLGNAYFEKGDHAKALKCYVKALDIVPDYIGAMIGAGQSLRYLGDHDRALRMGRQVLRKRPDDQDALFLVGATFFQRGDYPQAQPFLEHFLETNPEIEVALEVEGMLQICRGEVEPPIQA